MRPATLRSCRPHRATSVVFLLALVVGLAACGGRRSGNALTGTASIDDDWVVAASAPPTAIYVGDFVAPPGAVKPPSGVVGAVEQAIEERPHLGPGVVERRVAADTPTGEEVGQTLARSITQSLQGQGLECPVYRLAPGAPMPPAGWVVTGRLVSVDPGNRAERAAVGFGAGDATAEVEVDVDEVGFGTPTRVLQIGASSESGKAPGGAISKNPYVVAAKFVLGRNATTRDVERMGEAVAGEIAKQARAVGEPAIGP